MHELVWIKLNICTIRMLNWPQATQLQQALIIKNYTTLNGIPWHWPTVHYIHRHLRFYQYFGLVMACIGRNWSPLFKLIKYKIVVFDEVYILFHFNIILQRNGMSSYKKNDGGSTLFYLCHNERLRVPGGRNDRRLQQIPGCW